MWRKLFDLKILEQQDKTIEIYYGDTVKRFEYKLDDKFITKDNGKISKRTVLRRKKLSFLKI